MTRVVVCPAGRAPADEWRVELVERKGVGHPDTLADGVAEAISRAYADYTLERFGEVAHHWVDKCMLIGGESEISFGSGRLVKPMTLLVVGKVSTRVGAEPVPVRDLAGQAAYSFFKERLPLLQLPTDLKIEYRVNSAVGAGRPARWYRPGGRDDLTPLPEVRANDAVICSAYAPLSATERAVLAIERHLNGEAFKAARPEIGSDIKVLATRVDRDVDIVACVPFIADRTPSAACYAEGKASVAEEVRALAEECLPDHRVRVRLNTRDDEEAVYLTATGTAADTGDVGVVGRGNRVNGLITPGRTTSIEAPAGKNPTYHSGKIYSVLALDLARRVAQLLGGECYASITTSTGNPLSRPDLVAIEPTAQLGAAEVAAVEEDVAARLARVGEISDALVRQRVDLW